MEPLTTIHDDAQDLLVRRLRICNSSSSPGRARGKYGLFQCGLTISTTRGSSSDICTSPHVISNSGVGPNPDSMMRSPTAATAIGASRIDSHPAPPLLFLPHGARQFFYQITPDPDRRRIAFSVLQEVCKHPLGHASSPGQSLSRILPRRRALSAPIKHLVSAALSRRIFGRSNGKHSRHSSRSPPR